MNDKKFLVVFFFVFGSIWILTIYLAINMESLSPSDPSLYGFIIGIVIGLIWYIIAICLIVSLIKDKKFLKVAQQYNATPTEIKILSNYSTETGQYVVKYKWFDNFGSIHKDQSKPQFKKQAQILMQADKLTIKAYKNKSILISKPEDFIRMQRQEDGSVIETISPQAIVSPYQVAIFPVDPSLKEKANEIYKLLSTEFTCVYNEENTILSRQQHQDETGVPISIMVDYYTLDDNTIAVRERLSKESIRVPCDEIINLLKVLLCKNI